MVAGGGGAISPPPPPHDIALFSPFFFCLSAQSRTLFGDDDNTPTPLW